VDLNDTDLDFRLEVRAWLADNVPPCLASMDTADGF